MDENVDYAVIKANLKKTMKKKRSPQTCYNLVTTLGTEHATGCFHVTSNRLRWRADRRQLRSTDVQLIE